MSTAPVQLYGPRTVPKPTVAPIAINTKNKQQTPVASPLPPSPPSTPLLEQELTVSARSLMNHKLHPVFEEKYVLGEELGSGGFGFVVSAVERHTGIERAVKFIFRHKVPDHAWVRDPCLGPVPMEIYVLRHVRHPNVVNYVDFFQDEQFLYLVMELHGTQWTTQAAAGSASSSTDGLPRSPETSQESDLSSSPPGTPTDEYPPTRLYVRRTSCDLFECIERYHNFDELRARHIFRQIVECVAYLDTLGICHRDIKDENIVIDDQFRVKLIDFGSAVILPRHWGVNNRTVYFNKFYGTVSFASPEILTCKPYRAEPAEVWALGVLLYTMLFGEVPFTSPNMAISGRFAPPKFKVSNKCLHLLSCMLERNPCKRPTIHQVLMHPWFREL